MEDIKEKFRNAKLEDILKFFEEEYSLRKEKIEKIKEMIEKGRYEVSVEEVVDKILKFLKESR